MKNRLRRYPALGFLAVAALLASLPGIDAAVEPVERLFAVPV